jgi:LysM repeat protein
MKYVFCLVLITSLFCNTAESRADALSVADSVGVEKVGDKIFVLHKVNNGQTMFAVVREYGVTIQALRDANPGMKDQIQSGQTIRVPYIARTAKKGAKKNEAKAEKTESKAEVTENKAEVKESKPEVKETKPVEKPVATPAEPQPAAVTTAAPSVTVPGAGSGVAVAPNGIHTVEAGQTLYRVAVKYGVLMSDLRKWNNLSDDNLKDGQQLIVSEKAGEKSAAPVVTPHAAPKNEAAKEAVPEKVVKPVEEAAAPKIAAGKRKSESGLAEVIETDESTSKFLGLHRTAPIGALVEVLNEFNQEKIIVRVIGRIPDTSINDDIVIKLSSRAFEKVSPNSKRFRAVVSYLDNN